MVKKTMEGILRLLKQLTGISDSGRCLSAARVCAFAVCPPKGCAQAAEIYASLSELMDLGRPCPLPASHDGKRAAPETFETCCRVPESDLLQDSSGRLTLQYRPSAQVVSTVRGAAVSTRWLKLQAAIRWIPAQYANYFPGSCRSSSSPQLRHRGGTRDLQAAYGGCPSGLRPGAAVARGNTSPMPPRRPLLCVGPFGAPGGPMLQQECASLNVSSQTGTILTGYS
jgi:hypothetical protein